MHEDLPTPEDPEQHNNNDAADAYDTGGYAENSDNADPEAPDDIHLLSDETEPPDSDDTDAEFAAHLTPDADVEQEAYQRQTPHVRLVGLDADMEVLQLVAERSLEASRYTTEFPNQQRLSRREVHTLEAAHEALQGTAANDLLLDLGDRVLDDDGYRPFANQDDLAIAAVTRTLASTEPGMLYLPAGGVLWARDKDKAVNDTRITAGTVTHAAIQWATPIKVIEPDQDWPNVRFETTSGYVRPDLTLQPGLHSIVTDMITQRVMQHTGRAQGAYLHGPASAIGDALIAHTAETLGTDANYVDAMLSRGYFDGSRAGFEMLRHALSPETVEALLDMQGTETPREALDIANQFNLRQAAENIEGNINGRRMELFKWQHPAR